MAVEKHLPQELSFLFIAKRSYRLSQNVQSGKHPLV
jgi:hypothetical protein